ncbi:hypothetical protein Tco_0532071 [Tanacetum coccineum]
MVKNSDNEGKFLMYPRFVQVFLDNQLEGMATHDEIYIAPSHTKKIFANMKRQGKGFSGRKIPLFPTIMVQAQQEQGEGSAIPNDPQHTPPLLNHHHLNPKRNISQGSPRRRILRYLKSTLPSDNLVNEAALEIDNLKRRVKKLEKKQRSRTHGLRRLYKGRKIHDIDVDEDITLENVHDEDMFSVNDLDGDEAFVETEEPVVNAATTISTIPVTKRAEEKRNKPPTKAQQRSVMTTYLKNMAEWKPKDLKNKSFANVQE